jgi:hypothetical protein
MREIFENLSEVQNCAGGVQGTWSVKQCDLCLWYGTWSWQRLLYMDRSFGLFYLCRPT